MPQFEVDPAHVPSQMIRARTAAAAVRQSAGLADAAAVEVGEPEAGSGWAEVTVGGERWGRVRPRDRMRFRRD